MAASFASGWAIAEHRASDDPDTAAAAVGAATNPSGSSSVDQADPSAEPAPTPDDVTPPAGDPDASTEPASRAAGLVAPAVVLIDVANFGQGSGIVYDADGHIVTNAHVIGTASEVTVQLANGKRVEGTVVGRDAAVDVAVVKIDPIEDFGVAEFASTDSIDVGQLAVAIGSPFGLDQTVTVGVVSAIDRVVPNDLDGEPTIVSMIQTDASINPGNSGGALVDRDGRVIGMNTSIRTDGSSNGNVGVGFAIPAGTVRLIADRIINGEPLDIGFLGVELGEPTAGDPGALITGVNDGGPADLGGVQAGDLVVGFDDAAIRSTLDLAARVRLTTPGTVVDLSVVRDGETVVVPVTIGNLGDA